MKRNPAIEALFVDSIIVSNRHRPVDLGAVKVLAASMQKLGLRTPITIRSPNDSECYLVAGRHRLEAARLLGWSEIECFVLDCSEDEAEMWEISENLHRAELTVVQRSEQVSRWVELADKVLVQVAPKPQGGRPEGGVNKAARDLNLEATEVKRAVKIASLTTEAKAVAAELGLDDNQSALLAAAKVSPSQQATAIRERAAKQASKRVPKHPQDGTERSIQWRRSFEHLWNKAPSPEDREWAMEWVDRPIMDGSRAA